MSRGLNSWRRMWDRWLLLRFLSRLDSFQYIFVDLTATTADNSSPCAWYQMVIISYLHVFHHRLMLLWDSRLYACTAILIYHCLFPIPIPSLITIILIIFGVINALVLIQILTHISLSSHTFNIAYTNLTSCCKWYFQSDSHLSPRKHPGLSIWYNSASVLSNARNYTRCKE